MVRRMLLGMSPELFSCLGRATVLNLSTVYFGQLDCFQGLALAYLSG